MIELFKEVGVGILGNIIAIFAILIPIICQNRAMGKAWKCANKKSASQVYINFLLFSIFCMVLIPLCSIIVYIMFFFWLRPFNTYIIMILTVILYVLAIACLNLRNYKTHFIRIKKKSKLLEYILLNIALFIPASDIIMMLAGIKNQSITNGLYIIFLGIEVYGFIGFDRETPYLYKKAKIYCNNQEIIENVIVEALRTKGKWLIVDLEDGSNIRILQDKIYKIKYYDRVD